MFLAEHHFLCYTKTDFACAVDVVALVADDVLLISGNGFLSSGAHIVLYACARLRKIHADNRRLESVHGR